MGKCGYFLIIIGIATCFVGLFGASATGNSPVTSPRVVNFITLPLIGKAANNTLDGGVSARTLYLFAMTPLGVLAIVIGDILRRAGRDLNYRRDVRIAQAVEARRISAGSSSARPHIAQTRQSAWSEVLKRIQL